MTTIDGDVGNSFSGGHVAGDLTQIFVNVLREALAARALNAQTVRRLQDVHVATQQSSAAGVVLEERGAVALVGEPGTGRWITGIAVLAGLGLTPRTVVLDQEDLRRSLDVESGHGYLLDLEESRDQLNTAVGFWVGDLAVRLRGMGSCLVVRARERDWNALALDEHALRPIMMTGPEPVEVFESHLKDLAGSFVATDWARRASIVQQLAGARLPEAVRLARIVHDVRLAGIPEPRQLDAVLAAYANWADELGQWFHDTKEVGQGYRRALLLATAALEGAPAPIVCAAADKLSELVELPLEPGGALVGPDLKALVTEADAELREGRVCFTRPSYAESVLDHVWRERPHLRTVLGHWLIELLDPNDLPTARAARSLTALAIRQSESELIISAAAKWAKSPGLREVAVGALTAAAMSEQVGRDVRRRMYDWARTAPHVELHLAVAQVCAGQLAQAFPQIALTRLRHLAVRNDDRVRGAAVEALAVLTCDDRLRGAVLREVAGWVRGDEPRRSTGRRAFLRLAELRDEVGHIVLLRDDHLDALTAMWRHVLRHQQPHSAGQDLAVTWLEAAAQGHAPPKTVIEVFAATCESSLDLGILTKVVGRWLQTSEDLTQIPRNEIGLELLRRAQEHDLLGAPIIPTAREES
jgi:hypothetical protein